MNYTEEQLLELLYKQNYISEALYTQAKDKEANGGSSLSFLYSQNAINQDLIGQAIAESLNVGYADLNSNVPDPELMDLLPGDVALEYRLVVFSSDDNQIVLTTDDPTVKGLKSKISSVIKSSGKSISLSYSLTEDIDVALRYYQKPLSDRLKDVIAAGGRAPDIVEMIFASAVEARASDIHMEPQDETVVVRFRIDGMMHIVGDMEPSLYEMVLNRIKVLSKLRTDKHQAAQDGSIRQVIDGQQVDLRVSIVPIFDGEKVVMRLLTQYAKDFSLTSLGISASNQEQLTKLSEKPFGMLIVCGPTGSGKTTTLYGVLKHLNRPEVNISTIEDPVEYKIRGVNHIQVNREADLTFAAGLRSIVRQDPDIILVGEIRDRETAEISVNAALTGHLLLSTFHANDSATAIPRLLDMGIEPFLLSSTLEALMSQRLVRTICESCKYSYTISTKELNAIDPRVSSMISGSSYRFYKGKGCSSCGFTGFKGRTSIFEIIQISPELQDAIMTEPTGQKIWQIAQSQGAKSMFEDGLEKVMSGHTTIEELLRVAEPPTNYSGSKITASTKRKDITSGTQKKRSSKKSATSRRSNAKS